MIRTSALACAAIWLMPAAGSVAADDVAKYPDKPVRVVLGFSAGSPSDVASRVIGEKLSELWKQPFLTEYRPGAGGGLAAQSVAKAAPDGHTLLGVSASYIIQPAVSATKLYSTRDFVAITTTIGVPNVLVVSSSLGVKSVKDFVAMAKARPGELLFSSGGVGSGTHFSAELFKSLAAIDVRHVPYRGIPEALTEVVAGRIHFTFSPLSNVLPLLSKGEVVVLGVAPAKRAAALPGVPTLAEAGVTGYSWDTWFGLLAPAKTPPGIVKALNREIVRIIQLPDVKKRWDPIGAEALPMTPEGFEKYLSDQAQLVDKLVKAANIQPK
jgi:tripartite-type tricarboxylate transporter receptor subunit TctC